MAISLPARFNLAQHLLDENLRRGRGAHSAILTPDGSFSYAEVTARANRAAAAFHRAGVKRGDRVLTMLPDGVDFVASLFGTLKLGAVVAMANPDLPPGDQATLVEYTGAAAVVTTPTLAGRLLTRPSTTEARRPTIFAAHADDEPPSSDAIPWQSALASEHDTFPDPLTGPDDDAFWLFTSGSTGRPKAAIHRQRDFAAHIECFAKPILGLGADDVTFAIPRLYFPYATGMNLLFPFAVGASAVLCAERPSPEAVFALCRRFRPTVLSTVPTMTAKLLARADRDSMLELPSLRVAVSAGEALPPDLFRRWRDRFGEMLDAIGSAEMFHIYVSNRPGESKPGSLGRAVPGYEAEIMRGSDDGTVAGSAREGELGTLWVRGPSAARGYHDDPERSRAVFRDDGWVVTGDAFTRDSLGEFHYQGRTDDLLKVGGIYVSPLEVEGVLREHPAVADCAVVGKADADGLQKPSAFIVAHPGHPDGATLSATLTAFARERLAHFKVPRTFTLVDTLPRNDRGKLVRRALRDG